MKYVCVKLFNQYTGRSVNLFFRRKFVYATSSAAADLILNGLSSLYTEHGKTYAPLARASNKYISILIVNHWAKIEFQKVLT